MQKDHHPEKFIFQDEEDETHHDNNKSGSIQDHHQSTFRNQNSIQNNSNIEQSKDYSKRKRRSNAQCSNQIYNGQIHNGNNSSFGLGEIQINLQNIHIEEEHYTNTKTNQPSKKIKGHNEPQLSGIQQKIIDHHMIQAEVIQKNTFFVAENQSPLPPKNIEDFNFKPRMEHKTKFIDKFTIPKLLDNKRGQKYVDQEKNDASKRQRKRRENVSTEKESAISHEDSSHKIIDKETEKQSDIMESYHNIELEQGYQQTIKTAVTPILQGSLAVFDFIRQNKFCTSYLHPEFSIIVPHYKTVITGRKQFGHFNSYYNISAGEKHQSLTHQIGYLKGNFGGTQFNLFRLNKRGADLIATIIYKSEFSCLTTYREVQIYIKDEATRYDDLLGVSRAKQNLQQLYDVEENAISQRIVKIDTKQPVWKQDLSCFVLNFKGKSKLPSIKNTILVDSVSRSDKLMFCKVQGNKFYLSISKPFSPLVAMGFLLSSFDYKLFCQ